ARQIGVAAELIEPSPSVMGDRVQLQQVVLNLIMNGVEAMSTVADRPHLLRIRSRSEARVGTLVAVEDSLTGSSRRSPSECSLRYLPPGPGGWGWACRSAARSLRGTAAGCGLHRRHRMAPCCNSPCRRTRAHHERGETRRRHR